MDNLLDKTFGKEKTKKEVQIRYVNRIPEDMASDLIIMANYAINSIHNKKGVINKDKNSTYYQHYIKWSYYRKQFQNAYFKKYDEKK